MTCLRCNGTEFPVVMFDSEPCQDVGEDGTVIERRHYGVRFGDYMFRVYLDGQEFADHPFEVWVGEDGWVAHYPADGDGHATRCACGVMPEAAVVYGQVAIEEMA